jgi:hypothetical protein
VEERESMNIDDLVSGIRNEAVAKFVEKSAADLTELEAEIGSLPEDLLRE